MKLSGNMKRFCIFVFVIVSFSPFLSTYIAQNNYFLWCTIITLLLMILKQKREHHLLSSLIKEQTESYKAVLRHDIKTPVLAQIRAIELLLKGNFGKLNRRQKEMLKLTLQSCKHSYRIIHGQLYPNNV